MRKEQFPYFQFVFSFFFLLGLMGCSDSGKMTFTPEELNERDSLLIAEQQEACDSLEAHYIQEMNGRDNNPALNFKQIYGAYTISVNRGQLYADTFKLQVQKNDHIIFDHQKITAPLTEVALRDMDNDQKPEVYISWKDGNAEIAELYIHEVDSDSIQLGDLSRIPYPQTFFFTGDEIIHRFYLESTEGVKDVGCLFTHYQLVNNKFVLSKKKESRYNDDDYIYQDHEWKE